MTVNQPKSIDTHYNGYKFRSRIEARWAVFFDELRIAYEYEPNGFELNGVRYLPDFHLTNGLVLHQFSPTNHNQIWVEIKPESNLSADDRKKMAEFVKQTDHHLLLIAGQPDLNTTLRFIDHHPETGWLIADVRWMEHPDGQIGLVPVENLNNSQLLSQISTPRLRHALDKARAARFEFGQTPASPVEETVPPKETVTGGGVQTKICRACGAEFKPYRQHFIYCAKCYHAQNRAGKAVSGQRTTAKEKSAMTPKDKQIGCVLALLAIGAAILVMIWYLNHIFTVGVFGPPLPTATATIPATYTPLATHTPVPTPSSTPVPSPEPTVTATLEEACSCTGNLYDCSDFTTRNEAQACFDYCFASAGDIHFLDGNGDNLACESLP